MMPIHEHPQPDGSSPVTFATSSAGNATAGGLNLVGGVVGAAGRGLAEAVEGGTGKAGATVVRPVETLTDGVEAGAGRVAHAVRRAGEGK